MSADDRAPTLTGMEPPPPADTPPKRTHHGDPANPKPMGRPRKDGLPPGSVPKPPPKTPPKPRSSGLERRLAQQLATVGVMVSIVDPTCGGAVLEGSENLAKALDHLAASKPAVKRALEAFLSGSTYAELIAAGAPIIVTVLAHHGLIAPDMAAILSGAPAADQANGHHATTSPFSFSDPFVAAPPTGQ